MFPTLDTTLIFDNYIIPLLIFAIVVMLCYYYLDRIKTKIDNEAYNKELQEKYNELNIEYKALQSKYEDAYSRCKYFDRKLDREMGKIDILTKLIENTFNRVLNDTRRYK